MTFVAPQEGIICMSQLSCLQHKPCRSVLNQMLKNPASKKKRRVSKFLFCAFLIFSKNNCPKAAVQSLWGMHDSVRKTTFIRLLLHLPGSQQNCWRESAGMFAFASRSIFLPFRLMAFCYACTVSFSNPLCLFFFQTHLFMFSY